MRAALLFLGLLACEAPEDVDESDTDLVSAFERDLAAPLQACVACHAGDTPDGELDLTDFRAATLEQPSRQLDMRLITPGDHLESYLWHKVNGSHSVAGGAGTRMPVGRAWAEDDVALLGLWIDLGAEP